MNQEISKRTGLALSNSKISLIKLVDIAAKVPFVLPTKVGTRTFFIAFLKYYHIFLIAVFHVVGRTEKCSIKKVSREMGKEARRNQANQIRKSKRDEFMKLIRTQNDPPFVVALVTLNNQISYFDILEKFKTCDAEASVSYADNGYLVIRYVFYLFE